MILGWNNLVTGATVAATSAASGMPAANIQDDRGSSSVAWQTVAGVTTAALTITPSSRKSWRVFGLFRTNLTSGATMTVTLYTNPSTVVWTGAADGLVSGYGQIVLDAGAAYSADYATIAITDPGNSDTFLNIPLVFAGPGWVPSIGPSWSLTMGRDSSTSEINSRGGQEYPVFWWSRRRVEFSLDAITSDDLWSDAQEADRIARTGANILFIRNQTADAVQEEAIFGRIEVVADFQYPVKNATRFSWRARIRERI